MKIHTRRVLIASCVFFGLILSLNAQSSNKKIDKISWNTDGYWFLAGFTFEGYKPSTEGVILRVKDEVAEAKAKDISAGRTAPYAVIGHSQGGLRALAYASHLKKTDKTEYNRLQAVITVSGIDKGLKALDGGFPAVKSRFMTDVNTVWRGVRSIVGTIDVFGIIGRVLPTDISGLTSQMVAFLPEDLSGYLYPALNGASPDSMAEIRDMFPSSTFIQENVSKTKSHSYKLRTGTDWGWEIASKKVWGVRIYYPVYTSWATYTWYTAYEDQPVFGNELPMGYIVGLNSNTLSMMDPSTEKSIRKTVGGFETVFEITKNVHLAKNILLIGLFSNGIQYYNDAKEAEKWMANFDGELNELKCSTENDGLVAKESQFYPKTFTDPNTGAVRTVHSKNLGTRGSESYIGFNYNHADIIKAHDVRVRILNMIQESALLRKE